jgi:GT2 family glycosyltransferase
VAEVSVVIVEFFCIEDVVKLLESAKQHLLNIDWEAIVVSNSEYDATGIEKLNIALKDKQTKIILNQFNSGYAGGVNRVLPEIKTPFIYLLNPDARFVDGGIHILLEEMQKQPRLAVIGPKVIDEMGEIQPSSRRFPRIYTALLVRSFLNRLPNAPKEKARYLMEDFDRKHSQFVDWVSGGAMLLRTNAVTEVGSMDERYFLYMEDVDWCRTFWEKGWQVLYHPSTTIMHAGKHSSIGNGLLGLLSQTTRWHLASVYKYFCKWGLRGLSKEVKNA